MNRFIRWWRLNRYHPEDRILHALDNGYRFAVDIMRDYAITSGHLYAALIRLEGRGTVVSLWVGEPRRRAYGLSRKATRVDRMRALPDYQALSALVSR